MKYSSFLEWIDLTCRQVAAGKSSEIHIGPKCEGAFEDDRFEHPPLVRLAVALRSNTSVTHLSLTNVGIGKQGGAWLKDVLTHNKGLSFLRLEDTASAGNDGGFRTGLTQGLMNNKTLETLHLRSNKLCAVSELGLALSENNTLKELRLCHNHIDRASSLALCAGLKNNLSLQVLDLTGNSMNDKLTGDLCRGLEHHSSVTFLCLDFNDFGVSGSASIGKMLRNNTILKELHLFGNHIDQEGGRLIADSLKKNIGLRSLILSFNNLGDEGAEYLAESLTVNSTLKKLWLPANHLSNSGINAFARCLPYMAGLKQLNIGDYFDNEAAHELLQAVKVNMELKTLFMESVLYDCFETERQIDFYIRLNRAGRKILRHPNFSDQLWPHVLARANRISESYTPDVLYYLLRQKPDLFDR